MYMYLNLVCLQEKRLNRDIRLAVDEYWKPKLKAEDEATMKATVVRYYRPDTEFLKMSFGANLYVGFSIWTPKIV